MTRKPPPANLAKPSQAWVRWVEDNVTGHGKAIERTTERVANTDKSATSALTHVAATQGEVGKLTTAPEPPQGLTLTGEGAWDVTGTAVANVTATWAASEGAALYEVWRGTYATSTESYTNPESGEVTTVVTNYLADPERVSATEAVSLLVAGLEPGREYAFAVRAQGAGGAWSALGEPQKITVTAEPPLLPSPTAPTLTSDNGFILATWDGKLADGTVAPPQLAYATALVSATETGTYAPMGQTIVGAGDIAIGGSLAIDATYWVKLRVADKAGRNGGESPAVSVVAVGVDTSGLEADLATANQRLDTAFGDLSTLDGRVDSVEVGVTNANDTAASAETLAGTAENNAQAAIMSASAAQSAAESAQNQINLVNNVTRTRTLDRWNVNGQDGLEAIDFNGVTLNAHAVTSTTNTSVLTDWFTVDPTKAYEFRIWIRDDTDAAGSYQFYLGLYGKDGSGAGTAFTPVSVDGTVGADNPNYYFTFYNGPRPGWIEYVAYLLPYGTDPQLAVGLGKNLDLPGAYYSQNAIFADPNTTEVQFRWLNWGNDATMPRTVYAANQTVTETTVEAIRIAQEAKTAVAQVSKLLFSTNPPSGTAPQGTRWSQTDSSGRVIGEWQQTGAGVDDVWTPRPVTSDAISNLDVGKLVAGSADLAEAVINKLFTDVVVARTSVTTEKFIGNAAIIDGTIDTRTLKAGAIDGFLITGPNIQTSATAQRGVKINSSGIQGYSSAGVQTFNINGATGAVTITGDFTSGSGNNVFKATTLGLQLGHAIFSSAPFRVTPQGKLIATDAQITGTVTGSTFSTTGTTSPQDALGVWVSQEDGVIVGSTVAGNRVELFDGSIKVLGTNNFADGNHGGTNPGEYETRVGRGYIFMSAHQGTLPNRDEVDLSMSGIYWSTVRNTSPYDTLAQAMVGPGGITGRDLLNPGAGWFVKTDDGPIRVIAGTDPEYSGDKYPIVIHGNSITMSTYDTPSNVATSLEMGGASGDAILKAGVNGNVALSASWGNVILDATLLDINSNAIDAVGAGVASFSYGSVDLVATSGELNLQATSGIYANGALIGGDTGPIPLSTTSAYVADAVSPPYVRKIGSWIKLGGVVKPYAGGNFPTNAIIYPFQPLDPQFRPTQAQRLTLVGSNAQTFGIAIVNTDGTIEFRTAATGTSYFSFTGDVYLI